MVTEHDLNEILTAIEAIKQIGKAPVCLLWWDDDTDQIQCAANLSNEQVRKMIDSAHTALGLGVKPLIDTDR